MDTIKKRLSILEEKVNELNHMMWEDRNFMMKIMSKLDRLLLLTENFVPMDEVNSNMDTNFLVELTRQLSKLKEIQKEMSKYKDIINSDQVGES